MKGRECSLWPWPYRHVRFFTITVLFTRCALLTKSRPPDRRSVRCSTSVNSPTTATRKLLCRLLGAKTRELRAIFPLRVASCVSHRNGVALIYAFLCFLSPRSAIIIVIRFVNSRLVTLRFCKCLAIATIVCRRIVHARSRTTDSIAIYTRVCTFHALSPIDSRSD